MRINKADLESMVDRINSATNSPMEYSTVNSDGVRKSNVGHYCLGWAYGGVQFQRVCTDGGGVSNPIGGGYDTKKDLYSKLYSFLMGMEA